MRPASHLLVIGALRGALHEAEQRREQAETPHDRAAATADAAALRDRLAAMLATPTKRKASAEHAA